MKKKIFFAILLVLLLSIVSISACNVKPDDGNDDLTVTINGTELTVMPGSLLDEPDIPEKESTKEHVYVFVGWYIEGTAVKWSFQTDKVQENIKLVPIFMETTRKYKVTIGSDAPILMEYGAKLTEPIDPTIPDNLKYHWINEDTGETWDFENDFVQSDLVLVPDFTDLFTLYFLPEEITVAGNKYQTITFSDNDYEAMDITIWNESNEIIEHGTITNKALKLKVARGEYTYKVELHDKTFNGGFTVGSSGSYNAILIPEVVIGGYMGGDDDPYKYPSYGANYSVDGDSISMWTYTYAFVGDGTLVDKVYIEADVTFPQNALGMMAGIMPACEVANLSGDDNKALQGTSDKNKPKLVFSVSANNSLYSQEIAGWGGWDIISEKTNVAAVNTNYKLGVLRYESNYYVFVDDELKLVYTTEDFGKSGFGFCVTTEGGANSRNPIKNANVKYITDETVLNKMLIDVIGTSSISYDATTIRVKQSDVEIENNLATAGVRTYIEFKAPEGQILVDYSVSSNGGTVPVYEDNGKVYFLPEKGKDYNITATFESESDATVTVNFKPSSITIDGKEYELNDNTINPEDVTLSLYNFSTSQTQTVKVDSLSLELDLKIGKYIFTATYANNITEIPISITEENKTVTMQLSNAYMGGDVLGDGYTAKSYYNADKHATVGTNWSLTENCRDTVTMTNYTYVYYDGLYGSSYYAEAIFDTALPNYMLNTFDKFNGIMIASKHVDLNGSGVSNDDKMKVFVGIYGKSIVLNHTNSWDADNMITIANWEQVIGETPEQVKLGIVRDGTDYYFFVNDIFITKRTFNYITNKCGVGVGNLTGNNTIYKFNASTNPELIAALKAQATTNKQIDLYLIAGQSNASGYTIYDNNTMLAIDETLVYGNNNILYAGRAQYTNGSSVGVNEYDWGLARVGQGASNNKMSAEAAMATVLSSYYNTTSGKVAGIIKLAHGGTALLNYLESENAVGGNWTPKSFADIKGYQWAEGDPITGRLYRNFIQQVIQRINELKAEGYTEINIKGVWWMQGETDKYEPNEYKIALEYFISDLRRDLGEISGEDLSDLAIIIGEISRTSGSAESSTVLFNKKFIAMQDAYCETHDNVYINKNGDYDINQLINGTSIAVGTDTWHWNQKDMVEIGKDVGRIILEEILDDQ